MVLLVVLLYAYRVKTFISLILYSSSWIGPHVISKAGTYKIQLNRFHNSLN